MRCADLVVASTDEEREQLVRSTAPIPSASRSSRRASTTGVLARRPRRGAAHARASPTGPVAAVRRPHPAAEGRRPRGRAPRRARRPAARRWSSSAARAVPTARPSSRALHALVDELGVEHRVRFVAAAAARRSSPTTTAPPTCASCRRAPSRSGSSRSKPPRAARRSSPPNVGGLRSLVDDGDTGFLVDGRDPADFAAPIDRMLARRRAATMGAQRRRALAPLLVEHRRGTAAPSLRRPRARARWCSAARRPTTPQLERGARARSPRTSKGPVAAEPYVQTSSTTPSCAAGTCASGATAATRRRSTSTCTSARCATRCTSCPLPPDAPPRALPVPAAAQPHDVRRALLDRARRRRLPRRPRRARAPHRRRSSTASSACSTSSIERWFQPRRAARLRRRPRSGTVGCRTTPSSVKLCRAGRRRATGSVLGPRCRRAVPFGEVRGGDRAFLGPARVRPHDAIVPCARSRPRLPCAGCTSRCSVAAGWARRSPAACSTPAGSPRRSRSPRSTPSAATCSRSGSRACGSCRARRGPPPTPTSSWSR